MTNARLTRESGFNAVKEALTKLGATEEVKGKVIAVFMASSSVWWTVDVAYIDYLVRQLVTLFTHKFEDERMSIPANMVYLMAPERGVPSILLHWRVYLSLYKPYVKGWRLESIKDDQGKPVGMVAVIIDNEGNEWRWERYYDKLTIVERWKNKELMFAKTILKEALAIMFPHLNLLPPFSVIETYDPDDLDSTPPAVQQAPVPQAAQAKAAQASAEIIRSLAPTPPPPTQRDRSLDSVYSQRMSETFAELASLVGHEKAKETGQRLVSQFGAARFMDLSTEQKEFVLTCLRNEIETHRILSQNGGTE